MHISHIAPTRSHRWPGWPDTPRPAGKPLAAGTLLLRNNDPFLYKVGIPHQTRPFSVLISQQEPGPQKVYWRPAEDTSEQNIVAIFTIQRRKNDH